MLTNGDRIACAVLVDSYSAEKAIDVDRMADPLSAVSNSESSNKVPVLTDWAEVESDRLADKLNSAVETTPSPDDRP